MPLNSRHVCFQQFTAIKHVYVNNSPQTALKFHPLQFTLHDCYLSSFRAHYFVAQHYCYNFFLKKVFHILTSKNDMMMCCRNQSPYKKYLSVYNRTTVMVSHRTNRVTLFIHCVVWNFSRILPLHFQIFTTSRTQNLQMFISLLIWVKTGQKVATAEDVLVAKGKNLVANATDTLALSSPVLIGSSW